jgi:phage recombination protein Bet
MPAEELKTLEQSKRQSDHSTANQEGEFMTTEIQKRDEQRSVSFTPFGAADAIKLTVNIIQNLIAIPTKSGKTCSEKDAIKFMMLCRAKRLDPFEGDCFLLGYDSRDGVATFSLITAHQAYLKRAEVHPEFDGMKSGVIVEVEGENGMGLVTDLEGDFHAAGTKLLGGWATVYFKNRKMPMTRRLRLERFKKPFGVWNDDPAGMIVKCAEADALRSSFPTMLGSLKDADLPRIRELDGKCSEVLTISEPIQEEVKLPNPVQQPSDAHGSTETVSDTGGPSIPGRELGEFVIAEGFAWPQFAEWAVESGNIENAKELGGFDEVPAATARRLLRAKAGLVRGLQQIREAQSK